MNEAYSEPGFTATDTRDGDITHRVVVGGSVDSTQVGVYTLTYDVSDAADNAADQVIRTVTVEEALSAAEYFTVDRSGYYRSHLTSSVSRTTTNLQKHDGSRNLVSRQDQVYTNSANNETLTFNAMEFHNSSLNMGAIGNYSGPYTVSIFFRRDQFDIWDTSFLTEIMFSTTSDSNNLSFGFERARSNVTGSLSKRMHPSEGGTDLPIKAAAIPHTPMST